MGRLGIPHLVRRGDQFWFRMAVPRLLAARVGLTEIKGSLRTADRALARLRCRLMSNSVEAILATASARPDLPSEQIRAMIRRCFQRCLINVGGLLHSVATPGIDKAETLAEQEAALADLRSNVATPDLLPWTVIEMAVAANDAGLSLECLSAADLRRLKDGILRANIESARIAVAHIRGLFDEVSPKDPLFEGIATEGLSRSQLEAFPLAKVVAPTTPILTLAGATDRYIELKNGSGTWVKKTLMDNQRVLKLFLDLTGAERPIRSVVTDDVRAFRDALLKVPASYMKAKANAEKPLSEIIMNSDGSKALAPRTGAKYFHNLRAFLKWCNDEGHIDAVPGASIKLAGASKAEAKDARPPFTSDQLLKFFKSPQYSGHLSVSSRDKPSQKLIKDGKYWIPLIALFSGMRLGEIVQLLVTDIKTEGEVRYFDVARNEGEEKQLKTDSSRRKIPIHPELIKLGILDHVEVSRSKDALGRLFSDIDPGKDGYFSHNFSKWFGRYLKQTGVKTLKTSFHSFRHNFKDALDAAGIDESRRRALMGHADGSVHGAYGSRPSVTLLDQDIRKVSYVLPIAHLYKSS